MRIFVFSDTHGDCEGVELVLSKSRPDLLIHLGDYVGDAARIRENYPDIEVVHVCDGSDDGAIEHEMFINICGKRIFLAHGEQFSHGKGVTRSDPESEIVTFALQNHVDIVLYGHTHTPLLSYERGVFVMNPGSALTDSKYGAWPTFGTVEIFDDNVVAKILSIEMFRYLLPARQEEILCSTKSNPSTPPTTRTAACSATRRTCPNI